MAWGSSSLRSCTSLWERIERNDVTLIDLYILPIKQVTAADWDLCIQALSKYYGNEDQKEEDEKNIQRRNLLSIHASGHAIDGPTLRRLAQVLSETSVHVPWQEIAIGSSELRDEGVQALLFPSAAAEATGSDKDPTMMRLVSLDLSYKNVQRKGLQYVLEFAAKSPDLQKLDLSRNTELTSGVDDDNAETIFLLDSTIGKSNHTFAALQEINLSECNLNGEEVATRQLVSLLAQASPQLTILQCSHNPRLGASSTIVPSLLDLVRNGSTSPLQQLGLSNCGLTDDIVQQLLTTSDDVKAVAEPRLDQLGKLQTLDLSQNSITSTGMAAIAQALAKSSWPRLAQLNLAGNPLHGTAGVQVLVQDGLVPRQKNHDATTTTTTTTTNTAASSVVLELLDLSSTKCSVEAAYLAICQAHVRQLRLFDNQLGSSGFLELAAKLSEGGVVASSMECLDLAGNGASQEAVVALLRALLQLLGKNDDDNDDDSTLATAFLKASSLKTIIVGGNQGGADLEELVREIKQVRPDMDIARDKLKKNQG